MSEPVRDALLTAARWLSVRGWGKGSDRARPCVIEAIYCRMRKHYTNLDACHALMRSLGLPTDTTRHLSEWNDARARTKRQVIAALRKAASADRREDASGA